MSHDWGQLIKVREQQKSAAAAALSGARRAAEQTAARCDEAQRTLASCAGERSACWHGAVDRFKAGALDIEQLCRAGSFDAVASRRITEAHRHCDATRQLLQHAQAHSDHAQDWWRGRCAALEMAERMNARARTQARQREEQRAEEGAELAALGAWLRRPGRAKT